MKTIASISLGPDSLDCDFKADFLGQRFRVARIGTNRDTRLAGRLVEEWAGRADIIGLGMVPDHYCVGTNKFTEQVTLKLEKKAGVVPVTTGARLREIVQEWSVRSAQEELGKIFNNARILFMSGATNYRLASVRPNIAVICPSLTRYCNWGRLACFTLCARWSYTPQAAINCSGTRREEPWCRLSARSGS